MKVLKIGKKRIVFTSTDEVHAINSKLTDFFIYDCCQRTYEWFESIYEADDFGDRFDVMERCVDENNEHILSILDKKSELLRKFV